MLDHSITDHITLYDFHGTPDLIFKNFNIPRVTHFYQSCEQ